MVHFNVFLICLHYDQALATEGLVQQRFGVMAGSVLRMTVLWVNKH